MGQPEYAWLDDGRRTLPATKQHILVGSTEDEFAAVVAQAIDDDKITKLDGETVINAASVQLKCKLDNAILARNIARCCWIN